MMFISRSRRWAMAIVPLGLVLIVELGEHARAGDEKVYGINESIGGKDHEQWAIAFVRWAYGIERDRSPVTDVSGRFAGEGQGGPVWFLGGNLGGITRRRLRVPAGKPIFSPIIYVLSSRPIPPADWARHLKDVEVVLDGRSLGDLTGHIVATPIFDFTGPDERHAVHFSMAGKQRLAVVGAWFMLRPLPAGAHTLRIKGRLEGRNVEDAFELDITYKMDVEDTVKK